jgi:hypothetical protein
VDDRAGFRVHARRLLEWEGSCVVGETAGSGSASPAAPELEGVARGHAPTAELLCHAIEERLR